MKKSDVMAKLIIDSIFALDTKNLLTLNKMISEELNKRGDLNDFINKE